MKQNEDWAKVFCGTNIIHRIKRKNNGCLIFPLWFKKYIASRTVTTKQAMCQTMKFRRTKGKRTKPTSRKSAADAIGRDLSASGPNGSPHLGTLCHWIHNPIEVTEDISQILQRLLNADPGTVSQKMHSTVRLGCKSKDCTSKMHSGNSFQNCTYMVISE